GGSIARDEHHPAGIDEHGGTISGVCVGRDVRIVSRYRGWIKSREPAALGVVLPRPEMIEPGRVEVLACELHEVGRRAACVLRLRSDRSERLVHLCPLADPGGRGYVGDRAEPVVVVVVRRHIPTTARATGSSLRPEAKRPKKTNYL